MAIARIVSTPCLRPIDRRRNSRAHAHSTAAIIVAAGRGTRAGAGLPKQWRDLGRATGAGAYAGCAARRRPDPAGAGAAPRRHGPRAGGRWTCVTLVAGGADAHGLCPRRTGRAGDHPPDRVLIHDGARPFVSPRVIADVWPRWTIHPPPPPALAVVDALWRGADGAVGAPCRATGCTARKPRKGFTSHPCWPRTRHGPATRPMMWKLPAPMAARGAGAGRCEQFQTDLPADFTRAEGAAATRTPQMTDIRLGNGYDVHRFGPGDGCWLCGVKVPHGRALARPFRRRCGHARADGCDLRRTGRRRYRPPFPAL